MLVTYLHYIQRHYNKLDASQRHRIFTGLEALVQSIGRFERSAGHHDSQSYSERPDAYDPQIAKKIRRESDLTQSQLALELGLSPAFRTSIGNFEIGRIAPKPDGKSSRLYLEWLAAHGYNPLKL